MRGKILILTFFAILLFHTAQSQDRCTGELYGTIQNEAGELLAGAEIILRKGVGTISNEMGQFQLEKICPGKFTVRVQYIGYKPVEFEFTSTQTRTEKKIVLIQEVFNLTEVVIQDKSKNTEHNQNISQLGQKQLAESSGKSLGESLKEIPGVNSIQSGPGVFKPVIHGVHSQRILILNYGIRQEGQQWGAEHAPEIDPFIASNITVVKDASAIKYGTDALGGVIIVNPAALPESEGLGGSINTTLQSNGRSGTISGSLEGGIKDHEGWGWRVQGTSKRTGDFQAPDYNLTNTGVSELNYSAATGYHKDKFGIEAYFSHFQSKIGILKGTSISTLDDLVTAMESKTPQYTSDFSYDIHEPRQQVSHNLFKLNGHMKMKTGEWRFQYGFQNNNRKEFDIRKGSLSSVPSINLKLNSHTFETEWEIGNASSRTMCIGLTGMLQNNVNIFGTYRVPFIPNFTNASTGAFVISKFSFDNIVFDLGARYDLRYYDVKGLDFKNTLYQSNLSFHNVSATAGAVMKVSDRQTLSSNLSSAWRPPHVAELYSLGTHQSAAAIEYGLLLNETSNEVMSINDVPFKVEQALKWVNSYRHQWNAVDLEITGYANYIFNYIYLRPTGITKNVRGVYPYFRYTQTDAFFLGADVSATAALNDHWKVNSKASLLRASDVTNNDFLVFIPSNRYEVSLRYEQPALNSFKNLYFETKVKRVTQQKRAPRTITVRSIKEAQEQNIDLFQNDPSNFDFMNAPEGYWLWNMALGFSVQSEKSKVDFRLVAENILNTSYREYTNRFRYYADDLGRNFILSVKYSF